MKKLFLLLAGLPLVLSAQVKQTNAKIILDGKLDEEVWKTAPVISDFRPFSNSGKTSLQAKTEFRVLAAGDALYIGVRCAEPEMKKLKAPKSGAIWSMDGVEFFMAPTGQPDEFYQFLVTAGNIRWSMWYGEGGVIHPDPYAPLWDSKVYHGSDYWSIEAKFPWSGFYMTRNQKWKPDWLFNITRSRRGAAYENATWSPMKHSSLESRLFRTFRGFPQRRAREDIYIKSVSPASVTAMGSGYRATCVIEIEAQKAAAGNYQLELTTPGQSAIRQSISLNAGVNKISVPSAFFPAMGKNEVIIRLVSGDCNLGRTYPVNLMYCPVSIRLQKPVYSNVFFPDQDSSMVKGFLTVNTEKPVTAIVSISGDGVPEAVKILKGVQGQVPFAFATPEMKVGKSTLKVQLLDGKKEIASASLAIRRIAAPKTDWYRVENGTIIHNGKGVFLREVYAKYYQGGEAFQKKFDSDQLFIRKMDKVILEPFRLLGPSIEAETVKDIRPSQQLFDKIRQVIERNRSRNFEVYYLSDEPECRNISPVYLKYLYDYVKELDPCHPVLIGTRAAAEFVDCADIFSTHPYPDPYFTDDTRTVRRLNTPIQKSRNFVRDISRMNRPDKVIGLTPQFFSYGNITNRYSDYLTFEELECSIWSSIVNGARIQWPYAYHDLGDRPTLYEGMRYFFESIATLEDVICSGRITPLKSGHEMLEGVLIEKDGEQLLIVCNVADQSVQGELTAPKEWKKLYEFRGDTVLPPGKSISRTFRPLEVAIYRSVPTKGLQSRTEVMKKIAGMEKARGERGNVLFGRGYQIEIASSTPNGRNSLGQQGKLFDGTTDMLGWTHYGRGQQAWFEISFPKFVPTFTEIRLHGYNIEGVTVKIWKFGEWQNISVKPVKTGPYSLEWKLDKAMRTVKVRFDFDENSKNNKVELYEIEMVKQ